MYNVVVRTLNAAGAEHYWHTRSHRGAPDGLSSRHEPAATRTEKGETALEGCRCSKLEESRIGRKKRVLATYKEELDDMLELSCFQHHFV